MFSAMIDFTNVLLAALVVGAMFGVWLFLNPAGLDAGLYVSMQQQAIRGGDKVMPALGAATILVTIVAAVLGRGDRTRLGLLIAVCRLFCGRRLDHAISESADQQNRDDVERRCAAAHELGGAARRVVAVAYGPSVRRTGGIVSAHRCDPEARLDWIVSYAISRSTRSAAVTPRNCASSKSDRPLTSEWAKTRRSRDRFSA